MYTRNERLERGISSDRGGREGDADEGGAASSNEPNQGERLPTLRQGPGVGGP